MSVTKFTINRTKWLNGELYKRLAKAEQKVPLGQLRDTKGRMCCLGFYSKACGAAGLTNKSMPDELLGKYRDLLSGYILSNQYEYSSCNDNERLTTKERESRIKKLFAKADIKVNFIGKYPVIK
jgi:hypothetical protein